MRGSVIVNSAVALVITSFFGLGILGKCQNYLVIMNAVSKVIGLLSSSCYIGIGNTVAMERVTEPAIPLPITPFWIFSSAQFAAAF